MDRTIFHEVSTAEGWTETTQVDVLLGYIEWQQAHDIFRDYLEGRRADVLEAENCDDFTRAVADSLQHPSLALDTDFRVYCGNVRDAMTPEHAATVWWIRQFI